MGQRDGAGRLSRRGLIAAMAICALGLSVAAAGVARAAAGEPQGLIDQRGQPVTPETFMGKPSLVFLGFANCPSICPTALAEIADRMADLGPLADRLNVIFITADPERDTPEVLLEYLAYFDRRIVGLTGGIDQIGAVAKAIGAEFRKVPLEGGGYTVDHSSNAFLMDRNWQRTGLLILGLGADPKRATAKLRAHIGE